MRPWTLLIAVGVKPNAIRFTLAILNFNLNVKYLRTEEKTFLGARYDCRQGPACSSSSCIGTIRFMAKAPTIFIHLLSNNLGSKSQSLDRDFNLHLFVFQTNMFEIILKSGPNYAATLNFVTSCCQLFHTICAKWFQMHCVQHILLLHFLNNLSHYTNDRELNQNISTQRCLLCGFDF